MKKDIRDLSSCMNLIINISILLLILKDITLKNRSIGKKIVDLKIIKTNNKSLTIYSLILRNITLIIWPLDIIAFFITGKRMGDIIAKTEVIKNS